MLSYCGCDCFQSTISANGGLCHETTMNVKTATNSRGKFNFVAPNFHVAILQSRHARGKKLSLYLIYKQGLIYTLTTKRAHIHCNYTFLLFVIT